jgi:hypothetical protein
MIGESGLDVLSILSSARKIRVEDNLIYIYEIEHRQKCELFEKKVREETTQLVKESRTLGMFVTVAPLSLKSLSDVE